ncbi:PQQ-binding-like beta-propeller repeat protein [Streptomyces sp. NPDC005970]|uniref:outer membrane protein assembly factor BamB family protein n=1 Tax=Streptomyces sp. NPDC005970 TaxID=3156723 RepID=UPI00340EE3EE
MSQSQGRLPGHGPEEHGAPVPPTPPLPPAPPVPPAPPPAPAAGQPGRRGGWWAWIAGLTAVGLLLVGGAVVLWVGDGGGTSGAASRPLPKGAMAERWRTSTIDLDQDFKAVDPTLWAAKSTVTYIAAGEARGYDIASGEKKWVAKAPQPDLTICARSPRVNDSGIGALMYRGSLDPASKCLLVAAIDTDTGEVLWWKDLAEGHPAPLSGNFKVTVGAKALTVVMDAKDPVRRFSPADGTELTALNPPGDKPCAFPQARHTAVSVVFFTTCYTGDIKASLTLYDAETGRVRWSSPMKPGELSVHEVVADEPLTIHDGMSSSLRTYSSRGELQHSIPLKSTGSSQIHLAGGYLVGDSVLVTRVIPVDDSGKGSYAGYDLKTGKRLWERTLTRSTWLIGVEGGHVLVAALRDDSFVFDFLKIGLRDGEVSREGVIPMATSREAADAGRFATPYAFAWDERWLYVAVRSTTPEWPKTDVVAYRRKS